MTGCLTWLLVATLFAQTTGLDPEFSRLEDVWNAAHRNGDTDALVSLWADDLEVVVPRMLAMSKSDALAFARTGRMAFERYDTFQLQTAPAMGRRGSLPGGCSGSSPSGPIQERMTGASRKFTFKKRLMGGPFLLPRPKQAPPKNPQLRFQTPSPPKRGGPLCGKVAISLTGFCRGFLRGYLSQKEEKLFTPLR